MNKFLKNVKDNTEKLQEKIQDKLDNGYTLEDHELDNYILTDEDIEVMQMVKKLSDGEHVPGFDIHDFLASPSAKVLIPKVIISTARKSADPVYLASKFFKKVRLKNGATTIFPEFGHMRAYDVAEGQEIPQESIDWQTSTNDLIKVGKSGIRVQYSQELLNDVEFDVVGMLIAEAGKALARHKEQKAFTEFLSHGHTVFDNRLYQMDPVQWAEAGTGGLDYEGNKNFTMSIDDYLDIIIALYNNGFTCTDLVMHSLAWPAFYKSGFTGGLSAHYDREAKRQTPNGKAKIGPESIQGRVPFGFNVSLSPFAPIDKVNKTFDLIAVDANNVGVLIQKDDIKADKFEDPARDLINHKLIERYGFGVHNEGNAICTAKNISMAKSYPTPERVIVTNKK